MNGQATQHGQLVTAIALPAPGVTLSEAATGTGLIGEPLVPRLYETNWTG